MLDSLRIRIALKVISSKLPIGVATKYNVPVMLKKIISYVVLVFILTCCTLSSNEYSKKEDDIDEFKSKDLVLSASRLNSNIDIVFFEDKTAFQKSFLEGIKNGFFILREGQKRNSQINFIDFSKEKSLDLVQVSSSNQIPPVCKLLDYGKHIFQKKKSKPGTQKTKKSSKKEIKFRPSTDIGDYNVKIKKVKSFILDGDKTKITVRFRGREILNSEMGLELLRRVADDLEEISQVEQEPSLEGRQLLMVLAPKKKGN